MRQSVDCTPASKSSLLAVAGQKILTGLNAKNGIGSEQKKKRRSDSSAFVENKNKMSDRISRRHFLRNAIYAGAALGLGLGCEPRRPVEILVPIERRFAKHTVT